jgi:hypothetical protein
MVRLAPVFMKIFIFVRVIVWVTNVPYIPKQAWDEFVAPYAS